jgi:hypothetical protein
MSSALVPLRTKPGVYANGTPYQGRARWIAANGVRWIDGTMRPIGGWLPLPLMVSGSLTSLTEASIAGVPRGMEAWRGNDGTPWLAVGTTSKLYAYSGGDLYDITPSGLTVGAVDTTAAGGSGTYGYGVYGAGLYGVGTTASITSDAATWQLDVFGDYLVGSLTADGRVMVWTRNPGVPAAPATGAPTGVRGVVVTPERFLMALGTSSDVRKVTWASQETTTDWTPTIGNTAGSYPLTTNGKLMCGRRGRNQTLLWTDVDLHVATYIGGDAVYSFSLAAEQCGVIAPNAVASQNGVPFWMGTRGFWMYDGYAREIASDVADYVFGRLNQEQRAKIHAVAMPDFSEIWWFYPSNASTEIDSYVSFNVRENHWAVGMLARTAAVPSGVFPYPIMAAADGALYEHERGNSRSGMTPYCESGPIQIGEGDKLATILRIIPDEKNIGDVRVTLYGRLYPTSTEYATASLVVRAPTDARITGRQVRLRLEQGVETDWRIGEFRAQVALRGKR